MKAKMFSLGAIAPLVAVGVMGFSSSASAVLLAGSELQLTGGITLPDPDTILFSPDDLAGNPNPAPVGTYADTTIPGSSNTLSFEGYNSPNPIPTLSYIGEIMSFNSATDVPVEDFLLLPATAPGDAPSVPATTFTLQSFDIIPSGPGPFFESFVFNGTGFFEEENGDISDAVFTFTAQGFGENDINGSYSGSITVVGQDIPEPSATLGLLAFGMIGGAAAVARKRKQFNLN